MVPSEFVWERHSVESPCKAGIDRNYSVFLVGACRSKAGNDWPRFSKEVISFSSEACNCKAGESYRVGPQLVLSGRVSESSGRRGWSSRVWSPLGLCVFGHISLRQEWRMLRIDFPVLAMIVEAGTARLNKAKTVLVRQAGICLSLTGRDRS